MDKENQNSDIVYQITNTSETDLTFRIGLCSKNLYDYYGFVKSLLGFTEEFTLAPNESLELKFNTKDLNRINKRTSFLTVYSPSITDNFSYYDKPIEAGTYEVSYPAVVD